MTTEELIDVLDNYFLTLSTDDERVNALNLLRCCLHRHSPFRREPVDCVLWVKAEMVDANDYNPNVMAPTERRLLIQSLTDDGFTQPVVVAESNKKYLVVDGFHRQLLARKICGAGERLKGYLPVTCINPERKGGAERIAATIRHNRARGKHQITAMSDIVRDLVRLGWDEIRISCELGMDPDEVLRLKQISGLTELFQEEEYSQAWEIR